MTALRVMFLAAMVAAVLVIAGGGLRGEPRDCRGLAGCPHVVEVRP